MKNIEKLATLTEKIKLVEELLDKIQPTKSPKLQRVFQGIHTLEKAQQAMRQASQVQELFQTDKEHQRNSLESALPLLLLILNNTGFAGNED